MLKAFLFCAAVVWFARVVWCVTERDAALNRLARAFERLESESVRQELIIDATNIANARRGAEMAAAALILQQAESAPAEEESADGLLSGEKLNELPTWTLVEHRGRRVEESAEPVVAQWEPMTGSMLEIEEIYGMQADSLDLSVHASAYEAMSGVDEYHSMDL